MLCGKPVDYVLTYDTPAYVNIRDARLGILHYVLMLAIAVYVIVYQVFYQGQHLKTEAPIGGVSFQVQRPIYGDQADWWNDSDINRSATPMRFDPVTSFAYCNVSNLTFLAPRQKRPCRYGDEEDISIVSENSVFITTRVSEMSQIKKCFGDVTSTSNCTNVYEPIPGSNASYYVIAPEEFFIMFDHEVFTPNTGVKGHSTDYSDAKIIPIAGSPITSATNSGYAEIKARDVISIETLLKAGNVNSLDEVTNALFDADSTYRYVGAVLLVKIKYWNYLPWRFAPIDKIQYSYQVEVGKVYHAQHSTTMIDNVTRFWENRHGLTIQVIQMGQLSILDALQLTVFLASALALLTLANILVDTVAIRLLPEKSYFAGVKYQVTESRPLVAEFIAYRKKQGLPPPHTYDEFKILLKQWQQPSEDNLGINDRKEMPGRLDEPLLSHR